MRVAHFLLIVLAYACPCATGLEPYTDYSFVVVACTALGCAASEPSTGVWSSPRHLIINTSAVELYWDQPAQPNGHIFQYRLIRDGRSVFTGGHRDQNYTDTGLMPKHRLSMDT
ncbi:hypothetical protein GOODEAATRI_020259 [Goodea atripinnis]|uniref:Fibronectin type-III domain-containing protein n=1 Tax=Goodea atripinnis TaxID=208336 RepID=A0ABV0MJA9_9TELE